jgi:hypothetical protein
MAGFAVLSLATGLQIGALYTLLLWIGMLATSLLGRDQFAYAPMLAMTILPVALVALVAFGFPRIWAGFLEHARQTPSLTGWRMPRVDEALKIVRNAPGILGAAALLIWLHGNETRREVGGRRFVLVALTVTLAALVIIVASLFVLTANSVLFVGPIQPLAVGAGLALVATRSPSARRPRACVALFLALAALGSIRAVGLTTWGAVCAAKDSYPAALRCVRSELAACPRGSTAVLSSAYLYEAARRSEIRWVHSDWMAPAGRDPTLSDWEGLTTLKPARIILTQLDYYRRYEPLLARLRSRPDLAALTVVNTARVPAPDSIRPLQKVLQHVSWAPVVVTIAWR